MPPILRVDADGQFVGKYRTVVFGTAPNTSLGYASEDYQVALEAHGLTCSMSRRGNCYDAVMESFFATVKSEEAERFDSHGEAKMALFDLIEVFYNQRRRHSTLGQISPAEFERRALVAQAA